MSISLSSHTQPVVIKERAGEKSSSIQQRTPSVYLVGSRWNVAMLANTLTSTTRLRQPDGSFKHLGTSFNKHFNARWVRSFVHASHTCNRLWLRCHCLNPFGLCSVLAGSWKISLSMWMQRVDLNRWPSLFPTIWVVALGLPPLATWARGKKCTCSMHPMQCSGSASIRKNARHVCTMPWKDRSHLLWLCSNPLHPAFVLFGFSEDVPYDTLSCLKCHFCYRGIHRACVLDHTLPHLCIVCANPEAKKSLGFDEEEEHSTARLWTAFPFF